MISIPHLFFIDEKAAAESANNVSNLEDFVVESEMNDKDLGFLSSVDETNNLPNNADNNLDSDRFVILFHYLENY